MAESISSSASSADNALAAKSAPGQAPQPPAPGSAKYKSLGMGRTHYMHDEPDPLGEALSASDLEAIISDLEAIMG
jgi:hypothetical protein